MSQGPKYPHLVDGHCTVDPKTSRCTECGVEHGEPCPECAGRAFHVLRCCPVQIGDFRVISAIPATGGYHVTMRGPSGKLYAGSVGRILWEGSESDLRRELKGA